MSWTPLDWLFVLLGVVLGVMLVLNYNGGDDGWA